MNDAAPPVCLTAIHPSMPNAADSTLDSTDRGASLVEYALLLALIAVVCVGAMSFLGGTTGDSLSTSTSKMFVAD